jgi:hypothetical protein
LKKPDNRSGWESVVIGSVILIAIFLVPASASNRTDVVILKNGDHITGEIKALDRALLKYKTDDMSTIYIEWQMIEKISSKDTFDIELKAGDHYIGSIQTASESRKLIIYDAEGALMLDMASVVRITPLSSSFLEGLEGFIDLSFTAAQANNKMELSLTSELSYRAQKYFSKLEFKSYLSEQDSISRITNNTFGLRHDRFPGKKWIISGSFEVYNNSEQDIDRRYSFSATFGRAIVQSNNTLFNWSLGLNAMNELGSGQEESSYDLEGVFGLELSVFKFKDPETDLSTALTYLPSYTSWGRHRLEFDARLTYELFNDFFISLDLWDRFDNQPPSDNPVKNDWRITTGIGYKL